MNRFESMRTGCGHIPKAGKMAIIRAKSFNICENNTVPFTIEKSRIISVNSNSINQIWENWTVSFKFWVKLNTYKNPTA